MYYLRMSISKLAPKRKKFGAIATLAIIVFLSLQPVESIAEELPTGDIPVQSIINGGARGTFQSNDSIPDTAEIVKVGIEPVEVYSINAEAGTWNANFFIWWRWNGERDPSTTTSFTNLTDAISADFLKYAYVDKNGNPSPSITITGDKYQSAYVRAEFTTKFPLKAFPLDKQLLQIRLENTSYTYNELVYKVDDAFISLDTNIPMDGWKPQEIRTGSYRHRYPTDFGDIGDAFGDYSMLVYGIEVSRGGANFIIKLLLPLVAVILATLSALFVRQIASKSPLAIASTGLLTLVFTQQNYSQRLPENSPAVLMDKIYLIGYGVVLLVFARVVYRTRTRPSDDPNDHTGHMGSILDMSFAVALLIASIIASFYLVKHA